MLQLKNGLTLACMIAFIHAGFAQTMLSKKYLKSYPKSYFVGLGVFIANTDVDCYSITYLTTSPEGNPDTASGFISLPKSKSLNYPMLSYHHGTVGSRNEVPSRLSGEHVLPAIFSSIGFISIAPDYIGLGTSKGQHTYVHAASEASSSKDMLPAVLEFLASEGYKTTKDLFITGYSQGGHAGMALHRLLEGEGSSFKLRAASHMSGPYDISNSMKNLLLGEEEYALVAYAANVALSYNRVYGIFPNDQASDMFIEPYASDIEKYRREEIDLWELNELMLDELTANGGKAQPKRMFVPAVIDDIVNNPNNAVALALKDNDVYNWAPAIPTRLYYCTADDQVSYTNSIVAETTMKANGSSNVVALDVKSDASHTDCVNPAVTSTLFFFLGYYQTTSVKDLLPSIAVYPNPTSDYFKTDFDVEKAYAIDMNGRQFEVRANGNQVDASVLPQGQYVLLLEAESGQWVMSKVIKL